MTPEEAAAAEAAGKAPVEPAPKTDATAAPDPSIVAELQALREFKAQQEAAAAEAAAKAKAAEEAEAVARGEAEAVIEQLRAEKAAADAKAAKYDAYIESVKEAVEKDKAKLPAHQRKALDLIPDPLQARTVLDAFVAESSKPVGGALGKKAASEPIPESVIAEAKARGMDPQWWFETIHKPRQARKAPATP